MVARSGAEKIKLRAFLYLRLSVDKEDGNAQSIEAQRHAGLDYAARNDVEIVREYVDSGLSGTLSKRPEFNRMIADATSSERPVDIVLIYRQARFARNTRLPDREDWIEVPCPRIISDDQFERVSALRSSRAPTRMPPHQAAGTTLLSGIAKCGMPDCGAGMTIGSGTSRSRKKYYYYKCNCRTNVGQRCRCPNVRREVLDRAVFSAVQKRILSPDRLRQLLKGVLELSDAKRQKLEEELSHALAERTRRRTAIDRLLGLIEDGVMKASDPEFAHRLAEHRETIAAITSRIEVIESQLARGSRKITPAVIEKFSQQVAEVLQDEDSTLRSAYLRMFVSEVSVSDQGIQISGSKSVLERGLAKGLPRLEGSVPIFDQKWCRLRDSNT